MADFHFLRPLWLLALVPLGALMWHMFHRSGAAQIWERVCDPELLPLLLERHTVGRNGGPLVLVGVAGLLGILALAGPTWQKVEQPMFRDLSALVVLLDLSNSMDAADVKPSRITRARHKLLDILDARREGQTALIVYSGQSFTVSPLTDDTSTIAGQVAVLDSGLMPSQGSRPDLALAGAAELLRRAGVVSGEILLISDGLGPLAVDQVAQIGEDGQHRIHVLGVGTPEGGPIPLAGGGFLKDQAGDIVIARLDEDGLRRLAARGGGLYTRISVDDSDIDALTSRQGAERLGRDDAKTTPETVLWSDQGYWLLLLAMPLAILGFRRGYLVVPAALMLSAAPDAPALEWGDLWQRPDQQAVRRLDGGEPLEAARLFQDPQWKAAAFYRAGEYQQAVESLKGIESADAFYNRGNALARSGRLEEALGSYEQAIALQEDFDDARYNRDLVRRLLEQDKQSAQPPSGDGSEEPDTSDSGEDGQGNQSGTPSEGTQPNPQAEADDKSSGDQAQQSEGGADDAAGAQSSPTAPDGDAAGGGPTPDSPPRASSETPKGGTEIAKPDDVGDPSQDNPYTDLTPDDRESAGGQEPETASGRDSATTHSETDVAEEQWLRRVPEDPGGLLRRKFRLQYGKRANVHPEQQAW